MSTFNPEPKAKTQTPFQFSISFYFTYTTGFFVCFDKDLFFDISSVKKTFTGFFGFSDICFKKTKTKPSQ